MIPASSAYQVAGSVEEAVSLLGEHGDSAKLPAGGQSLLPLLKLRFVSPGVLIDLGRLEELRRIDLNGVFRVGALVTHDQIGRHAGLAQAYPLIADAAADVADPSCATVARSVARSRTPTPRGTDPRSPSPSRRRCGSAARTRTAPSRSTTSSPTYTRRRSVRSRC